MTTITEVYRLLFGKGSLTNGDVISMAEHGRVGGVSTGQPFKFVGHVQMILQVEYDGSSNPIYLGKAKPGTASSVAGWQIMNLTFDGSNNCTSILYADGNANFDNVWDDRAGLSYS